MISYALHLLAVLGLLTGGLGCSVTSEQRISKPIRAEYSVDQLHKN